MKAISVKQPWANLIVSGRKTIETRTWKTSYRGDLVIVSSTRPKIHPAGYALAIVELVDCRRMRPSDQKEACCRYIPDLYAWVFANIRPMTPRRVVGRLGVYDIHERMIRS